MDFGFSEEQEAAREAAKGAFAHVAVDTVPSPALTPGAVADDFDRDLWDRLARADLLGLTVPVRHGGSGLDAVALCLVLREAGRVLARVPLVETGAAALTLAEYGSDELCARLLPRIARGELALTVAGQGASGHERPELAVSARPSAERLSAERPSAERPSSAGNGDGGGWVLDGVQTAVPWGRTADLVVVPAHTADGRPLLAVLAPGATSGGVVLDEQASTNGEPYARLRLDAVRVPAGDVIEDAAAPAHLWRLLTTGTCALALGLGSKVLEMTSAYVSGREQFGFPVATFQAVAVQSADRYIDLRAMEATLWQAAWRLDPAEVAVAKMWASDGVRRLVQTAQHLHGGMGTDTDYPLHRFHAWAKQWELSYGSAAAHEEALGELLAAREPA
ncbi:acyl-CoA dehydrogenase family protein [Streptomyces reniochalinae]|uniref:Acyl-CoA dehydrogenase n=1 Tax=Streptomyces reniochalinae TaxID=2250578 RepID=A0A367EGN8_9ACTN|nr:acyl-CoA dehydrogenase family protein [Streptomyces reniochalinae]RCG17133.1 acyl-CoA dehydrogenase [Streptomyces reniochalinae]